ncbi:MAG: phosphatase PAP2 family protein [Actinobacteria bacterium]|nr:phosphatase PAP2 family protein [Actinomycetota bacterium]
MNKNQSKFVNFIKNRFNINSKNGLYLTAGVVLVSFFTYVFFNFIEDLFDNETLAVLDLNMLDRVQNIRNPFLNIFMLSITHLGDWQTILIFSIIIITVLAILSKWKQIIAVSISTILGETFVYITKNIIKRQGPPLRYLLFLEKDFSFPSGHSFISIAFYGLIFYFVFDFAKSKIVKILSIFVGCALVILISFSRIYLGVHWPSDVFASLASGIVMITIIITILKIDGRFGLIKADKK